MILVLVATVVVVSVGVELLPPGVGPIVVPFSVVG